MQFTIEGKIVPYVRMTRRGKYVSERARTYLASQDAIKAQLAAQMGDAEMFPPQTPLKVYLILRQPSHLWTFDLDNALKAVLDAAQGIVFHDDRWIALIHAVRVLGDEYVAEFHVGWANGA
jgi:crossover junction endodeoxyribonuclease RusA